MDWKIELHSLLQVLWGFSILQWAIISSEGPQPKGFDRISFLSEVEIGCEQLQHQPSFHTFRVDWKSWTVACCKHHNELIQSRAGPILQVRLQIYIVVQKITTPLTVAKSM